MQHWNRFVICGIVFSFFGAIFVLSCILTADSLLVIIDYHSLEEKFNHDAIPSSTWLEDNSEEGQYLQELKVVCYLTMPGADETLLLSPVNIDPSLCTHLIVGFGSVVNCTLTLGDNIQLYQSASKLKLKNPDLKVMISVGGINEISSGFPEMTRNHTNRKIFIRSVLNVTKTLNLDGLDIDWEFPAWLDVDGRQKIHYIQLLHELRKAFDKRNQKLVLSAAVAAPEAIIDQSYNVPQMAEYLDFVNLMAYDYHFFTRYLPLTGFNAPLFPSSKETNYLSPANVNRSAHYWMEKGMPPNKIVVGIPTYGHSYHLINPANNGIEAPCSDYGTLGFGGFVSYSEICAFLSNGAMRIFDDESKVPYAVQNTEWISYDDVTSITIKANWIRSAGFGGAMIFSLNADDWNSTCEKNISFPLTRTVTKIIRN